MDKNQKPHVLFNMKFEETNLYFAQMFYLNELAQQTQCVPKSKINYQLMMNSAQSLASININVNIKGGGMEGADGVHNAFWEIMQMNLFNHNFNRKYQQKIEDFIHSTKAILKIENYCVKFTNVFEIYDSNNQQKGDLSNLKQKLNPADGEFG